MPRTGRLPVPAITRFEAKIEHDPATGCWLWQAGTFADRGYVAGQFWDGAHNVRAHRFAWEQEHEAIPDGLQLYRTCATPLCVAPAHHELGAANRRCADASHCPQGHRYFGENLIINATSGGRQCRTCLAEYARRSAARPAPYRLRRQGNYRGDVGTAAIVAAYAMGSSLATIAADMGTSRTTIRRRLRSVGAPVTVGIRG